MHNLIIMAVCVLSLERTFAYPLPGEKLIFPNRRPRNMTLDSVQNAYPPKAPGNTENSGPERMQISAADKDKLEIFMYGGRIISTLTSDPSYYKIKDKLKNPESKKRGLPDLLEAMSNTTRTKLDKLKAEESQKYLKKCESQKNGTEPPKQDYLDMQNPENFSATDFKLVIMKVSGMRSFMDQFVGGYAQVMN